MSIAGELSAAQMSQELQSAAAMCGGPLPFPLASQRTANVPTVLRSLPLGASQELERIQRTKCYQGRSVLFHQGERLAGVFVLRRGTVKLSVSSSKGRAVILQFAQMGEILGLASVLLGEPCFATAEALEESEIGYVDRDEFLQFLIQDPQAALSVACQACSHYEAACRQVSLLALCRSASERVAQFLLNWASLRTYRGAPAATLRLTHEEISQVAGTTRETVTRTLIDFRKKGWASLAASHLLIQDREALEKLVA